MTGMALRSRWRLSTRYTDAALSFGSAAHPCAANDAFNVNASQFSYNAHLELVALLHNIGIEFYEPIVRTAAARNIEFVDGQFAVFVARFAIPDVGFGHEILLEARQVYLGQLCRAAIPPTVTVVTWPAGRIGDGGIGMPRVRMTQQNGSSETHSGR